MATGVQSWSKTAATNATADSNVNWAEGMAPSAVNDSARAEMASVAKWRDDISGTITTGGSSTAFTVTTNQGFASAAAMSGAQICFIPHTTSGASPTLAVDGLTARAINASTGVAVPTGYLVAGTPYIVTYVHASTEFIVRGVPGAQTVNDPLIIKSTDAGAGLAPTLDLFRDSASPAASDFIGSVDFNGRDSAANKQLYARLVAQITDPTSTSEDAILLLQQVIAGALTTVLSSSATALQTNLDLAVNTNKFNVTASNGNTAIAGTLAVTGNATHSGDLSGATASGAMIANQAEQEAASVTNKIVTPGTQQLHPSAAKAWVRFNGTGTVSIGASYNVTSVTDNGVGKYTLNFTIGFSSSQFAAVGNANLAGTFVVGDVLVVSCIPNAQSTCQVLVSDNNADTLTDPAICSVMCSGDQ